MYVYLHLFLIYYLISKKVLSLLLVFLFSSSLACPKHIFYAFSNDNQFPILHLIIPFSL